MAQNSFDISNLENNIRSAVLRLPALAGNEVVNFALDNFKQQGFLGNSFQRWPQRKVVGKKNKGKAILIQTGRLKRSIRIIRMDANTVVIGSDVPYAKVHNDGFRGTVNVKSYSRNQYKNSKVATDSFTKTGKLRMKTVQSISGTVTVREHTMKMNIPKRTFLADSPYLQQRVSRIIAAELMKAAKQ
jgi:phage gpG-like protein